MVERLSDAAGGIVQAGVSGDSSSEDDDVVIILLPSLDGQIRRLVVKIEKQGDLMPDARNSWVQKVISGGPVQSRSSEGGWPFWIPVIVTTIPFVVLVDVLLADGVNETVPRWQWIVIALPVGLAFAMILGLFVHTVWSIRVAVGEKRFDWFDAMFALFLLALCAGLGFLYWRYEQWFEVLLRIYVIVIIFPMVGFYIHRRERSRRV